MEENQEELLNKENQEEVIEPTVIVRKRKSPVSETVINDDINTEETISTETVEALLMEIEVQDEDTFSDGELTFSEVVIKKSKLKKKDKKTVSKSDRRIVAKQKAKAKIKKAKKAKKDKAKKAKIKAKIKAKKAKAKSKKAKKIKKSKNKK